MIGAPPSNPFDVLSGMAPPLSGVAPLTMPQQPAPPAAQLVPRKTKPSFWGILSDALAAAAGMPGAYAATMRERTQQQDELDRQMQIYRMKQQEPIRTQVGDDYVQIDPNTGQSNVLYHAPKETTPPQPTEYERLLLAAGIRPGTPAYSQHINSYLNVKENPPYYFTDPTTGQVSMIPRTPQKPLTDQDIDRMSGGQTPPASGGFPR